MISLFDHGCLRTYDSDLVRWAQCVAPRTCRGVQGAELFCSKCGSTIPDESTYCMKCGQATYAATGGSSVILPPATGAVAVPGSGAGTPVLNTSYVPAYEIRPVYAGFWLRFVAYVLDAVILGIFAIPILFGAAMLMGVGAAVAS